MDNVGVAGNIAGLFFKGVDTRNDEQMRACEWTFKNLALHYIEQLWPTLLPVVRFDDTKLQMMLKRFYRDAWGVYHFNQELRKICPDEATRSGILREMDRQSIRINTSDPLKTRIAASFSLWMATFRPIYLLTTEELRIPDSAWCLDAAVNFLIARRYLANFGEIKIGIAGKDRQMRLKRILYDFTVRDINLSSLEFMYASIFVPVHSSSQIDRDVPVFLNNPL